jgi:hypothetical protein
MDDILDTMGGDNVDTVILDGDISSSEPGKIKYISEWARRSQIARARPRGRWRELKVCIIILK